jgi:hypothetical protein
MNLQTEKEPNFVEEKNMSSFHLFNKLKILRLNRVRHYEDCSGCCYVHEEVILRCVDCFLD